MTGSKGLWITVGGGTHADKIAGSSPKTRRRVRELQQAVAEAGRPNCRIEGGLEVFERNAIASALQVFGGVVRQN
jgi:hypothetical protein